ncbi:UNVERIFIED_CONTAM: ferrous iron transport protein A [Acetivibrio alkalicellulosi]
MNTVLSNIKKSTDCIIEKLPAIGLLNSLGLRKGTMISSMTIQPFGGPVVIRIGRRSVALSRDIAEKIEVRQVG